MSSQDEKISVQQIFKITKVSKAEIAEEKQAKKTSCDTPCADALRQSQEYCEYLSTLRRINARGNTDTEHYIQTWASVLKNVNQKVQSLKPENKNDIA